MTDQKGDESDRDKKASGDTADVEPEDASSKPAAAREAEEASTERSSSEAEADVAEAASATVSREPESESSAVPSTRDAAPASLRATPARWGEPLVRVDAWWTKVEVKLCVAVLVLEIVALSFWVALRGLSTSPDSGGAAGTVFRALVGAIAFGFAGFYGSRLRKRDLGMPLAAGIGALLAITLTYFVHIRRATKLTAAAEEFARAAGAAALTPEAKQMADEALRAVPASFAARTGLTPLVVFGAVFLAFATYRLLRSTAPEIATRWGGLAGVTLGLFVTKAWLGLLVDWSSNLLNWYQQASSLTLLGGLRGVGTRLTLLLALIGGSLATAAGKHITIDLVTRFLKPTGRLRLYVVGWVGAAIISAVTGWGFLDHIAIENFGAKAEARPSEKLATIGHGLSENWFMLRKQVALDFKTFPHVVSGERYANWLGSAEWNEWIESSGFAERYGREKFEVLKLPEGQMRAPIIVIPEVGEPRGELIHAANLVVPFGLFVIALRFLLLCLLTLSGHRSVELEAEGTEMERRRDADAVGGNAS